MRSIGRGRAAANSIRLALRASSMVATSRARFPRCVLRCLGSLRRNSSATLPATCSIPPIPTIRPAQNPIRTGNCTMTGRSATHTGVTDRWSGSQTKNSSSDMGRRKATFMDATVSRHAGFRIANRRCYPCIRQSVPRSLLIRSTPARVDRDATASAAREGPRTPPPLRRNHERAVLIAPYRNLSPTTRPCLAARPPWMSLA